METKVKCLGNTIRELFPSRLLVRGGEGEEGAGILLLSSLHFLHFPSSPSSSSSFAYSRVIYHIRIIFAQLHLREGYGGQLVQFNLRVFARKNQTVYYKSCRRPDSDSDETCSRRSTGPKTKLETPLLTIRAHT